VQLIKDMAVLVKVAELLEWRSGSERAGTTTLNWRPKNPVTSKRSSYTTSEAL
jgi:hypothetical protein